MAVAWTQSNASPGIWDIRGSHPDALSAERSGAAGADELSMGRVPAAKVELSPADLRALADLFLLLNRWDTMSTMVTREGGTPEPSGV